MSPEGHDYQRDMDVNDRDHISDAERLLSDRGKQSIQGFSSPTDPSVVDAQKHQEWKDKGIQMVSVADLPDPADFDPSEPGAVFSEKDFHKTSKQEMEEGLIKLEAMKPYIESGEGANPDFWKGIDQKHGLDSQNGYRRVYKAFYGDSAIKVGWNGSEYEIDNGHHRIWVAKRIGIKELPVRLKVSE
jgi:hypothetical protein